jgi:hypothetical protein
MLTKNTLLACSNLRKTRKGPKRKRESIERCQTYEVGNLARRDTRKAFAVPKTVPPMLIRGNSFFVWTAISNLQTLRELVGFEPRPADQNNRLCLPLVRELSLFGLRICRCHLLNARHPARPCRCGASRPGRQVAASCRSESPAKVLFEAQRLECLLFPGYDQHFEGNRFGRESVIAIEISFENDDHPYENEGSLF